MGEVQLSKQYRISSKKTAARRNKRNIYKSRKEITTQNQLFRIDDSYSHLSKQNILLGHGRPFEVRSFVGVRTKAKTIKVSTEMF